MLWLEAENALEDIMPDTSGSYCNGFHHVALEVKDFNKSWDFYRKGLGFTVFKRWGDEGERVVLFDTGRKNYLEIFENPDKNADSEAGAVLHIALETADVDSALDQAKAAGAEVTENPKNVDIPSEPPFPVRIAFCKGPDGELIEFFQIRET